MAYINFNMEKEEDIFDFVAYVVTYHNHVLQGYQDYQIILVGKLNINDEPGYYMVTNDENILFFTLTDNQTDMFIFIDKNYIDNAYLTDNQFIILKYFKTFVYNLSGENGDIISLFQFLNINNNGSHNNIAQIEKSTPIYEVEEPIKKESKKKEEKINIYEVEKPKKKDSTRKSNFIVALVVVITLIGFAYYML